MIESINHLFGHSLVDESERNVDRAGPVAVSTLDASTGKVKCPYDIPFKISECMRRGVDPLRLIAVDNATAAVAHRASLAAGVAFDAP